MMKMRLGVRRVVVMMAMVIADMTRNMDLGSPVEVHFSSSLFPIFPGVFLLLCCGRSQDHVRATKEIMEPTLES